MGLWKAGQDKERMEKLGAEEEAEGEKEKKGEGWGLEGWGTGGDFGEVRRGIHSWLQFISHIPETLCRQRLRNANTNDGKIVRCAVKSHIYVPFSTLLGSGSPTRKKSSWKRVRSVFTTFVLASTVYSGHCQLPRVTRISFLQEIYRFRVRNRAIMLWLGFYSWEI